MTPRLEALGIDKRFGATHALREASLVIAPGEVHALIGENGAGKSTLMKVLSGACHPDAGELRLDGKAIRLRNPLEARAQGIAMIYQELNLAPDLSIAENVLLGVEPNRWGWIDRKQRDARTQAALDVLGVGELAPDRPVGGLTIAEKQLVEIARALAGDPRVVIMDEPTSSLTSEETAKLFAVIRELRRQGVSVIYISHFLEECQDIADRYTVVRDGQVAGSGSMQDATMDELVALMVGREVRDIYALPTRTPGEPLLKVSALSGRDRPTDVSFTLRAGEIFGLAGLVGAGRTETLRVLFGLDHKQGGQVEHHDLRRCQPKQCLDAGIGMLSENRKEEGLVLERSVADNLTLSDYQSVSRWGWIREGALRQAATRWISELAVKADGPDQPIRALSGGNQQKIAIGRLLHHGVDVLLLDEPTRGIDVASKQQVYQRIGQLAQEGKGIVFVSSYLPELLGVCDTIGVMRRGRLIAVKPTHEWTEHDIMLQATGAQRSLSESH